MNDKCSIFCLCFTNFQIYVLSIDVNFDFVNVFENRYHYITRKEFYIEFIISCFNNESGQFRAGGGKGSLTGVAAMLSHSPGSRDPSEPLHCMPDQTLYNQILYIIDYNYQLNYQN